MEQKYLSKWLRFITVAIAFIGGVVFFFAIPDFGRNFARNNPEVANYYYPWLAFIWTMTIIFYIALAKFWSICNEIHNNRSFSQKNISNLIWISRLAIIDSIYCFIGNIVLLILNMNHPGVFIGFMVVVFVGIVIAIVAATLSHLARKANLIEEENELTV